MELNGRCLIHRGNYSDQGEKMSIMNKNSAQGGKSCRHCGQSEGRGQRGWSCEWVWKRWPVGRLTGVGRTWLGRKECGEWGGHLMQYFTSLAAGQDHYGELLKNTKVWVHSILCIQILWGEAWAKAFCKLPRWFWDTVRVKNHYPKSCIHPEMIGRFIPENCLLSF